MSKVHCAAIQMASGLHIEANLLEAERLIKDAAGGGAKLVVLPENFALMGKSEHDKVHQRETDGTGPIQEFLHTTAKRLGIWLIGGTLPIAAATPDRVRAASVCYNDQGQRVARYDKIHLFDVDLPGLEESYRESNTIEPGDQRVVVDAPFGTLGLAVCYDLRFPELFRDLSRQGMEILVLPSAFTAKTGAAHWEVLVRARAIENQCYVIAPNQGGFHLNGRETYGHSMIVDPWGTVLTRLPHGPGVVSAEIDLELLYRIRGAFPALRHRRPQLYEAA